MKNIILKLTVLVIGFTLFASCETEKKHPNQFTISGEIEGLSGNLYFRHPDKEYTRETKPDSIVIVDGKFKFSDTISKLTQIRLYPSFTGPDKKLFKASKGGGFFPVKCAYLTFYAFPGADVTVKGKATDFMDAYPSGDKLNESLAAVNRITYPMFNKMGNFAVQNTYETDSIIIAENEKKSEAVFNSYLEKVQAHMKENPNSLGAVWYLNDLMLRRQIDDDKAEELFNSFSKDLEEYSDYKNVATRIAGTKATKEGAAVPSIKTTATLDGKEFDINSLRGKYVLIDFWGIWCGPCVAEMPQVKEFQEKHKEKLVVLGINSGDSKEKIQEFVDKHNYSWMQLMSDKKNTSDNFVNRFNVQGFPTKFIIDPRGTIVKKYLGGGEEAFELLEELLNK